MTTGPNIRTRLGRIAAPAAITVVLAGGGPAAAGVRPAAPAGTISTVAGGIGGPAKAGTVSLESYPSQPCGVTPTGDSLYVATGNTVRKVSQQTAWLTTVAGADYRQGEGIPAISSAINRACAVAVDRHGNLVLTDFDEVRVIAARTGTFYGQAMTSGDIYTVAGQGSSGLGVSGVPATQTKLEDVQGVAVDPHGNLVIADNGADYGRGAELRVVAASSGAFYHRKMTAGYIYTIAGYRKGDGYSGDGGPARLAQLRSSIGTVGVDGAGNLVFADTGAYAVRVAATKTGTYYGQAMTSGDIYTVAGDGTYGFSGDGGPATSAELGSPQSVTVDGSGNVVIADSGNNRVRVVAETSGTFYGQPMTAGHIYTVAGDGTSGFSGNGGPATSAEFSNPQGVALDGSGNVVIADTYNNRVRVVPAVTGSYYGRTMTADDVYTVAGNGKPASGNRGPATTAELAGLGGITTDSAGDAFFSDGGEDPSPDLVQMVPASSGTHFGQPMTAGHIYTVAGDGGYGFSGNGGLATRTELAGPAGLAVDAAGNLVISDAWNYRVRVVAATSGTFYGLAMTAGHIYTVAGGGHSEASGISARRANVYVPDGLAIDGAGNLVIAENYACDVVVVAESTGTYYGQAMIAGDIYRVAGQGYYCSASGDGGPALDAGLEPTGVAVDGHGDLVIDDAANSRIRVVAASSGTFYGQPMTAGHIYTAAGDGTMGSSGDGGPATAAEINPYDYDILSGGVAVDAAGNLLIADTFNNRVRAVAASSGTFYGQPMTAGDIYTVAGGGTNGLGDGGAATSAELIYPVFVAVNSAGDLLISDTDDVRVRMVTGGPTG